MEKKTQLLIYNEYSKKRKATSLLYWEYGVVFVAFLCHNDGIIITWYSVSDNTVTEVCDMNELFEFFTETFENVKNIILFLLGSGLIVCEKTPIIKFYNGSLLIC